MNQEGTSNPKEEEPAGSSSFPDVVYPYRHSTDDGELRHSLRSLEKHLPHRNVWLVGEKPPWAANIRHLPRPNAHGDRYRNTLEHIREASKMKDLSETFILMNDDFFLLQPLTEIPVFHRGPLETAHPQPGGRPTRTGSPWRRGIWQSAQLLERWGFTEPVSYELHVPLPIERRAVSDILERAVAETNYHQTILQMRTLYGNANQIGGELMARDPKASRGSEPITEGQLFLSSSNRSFTRGRIGQTIRAMFPEPSRYEREGA